MKKILLSIIILLIFCISCTTYVELYKTESKHVQSNDKTYLFENDTVKIVYSFWTEKGIMAFSIFNKLDKPLYIDWKKSNYISNSKKFDYWADKETSTRHTTNYEYYNKSLLLVPFLTNYLSSSVSNTVSVKPERITFIPPKAIIFKSDYFITTSNYNDWDKDFETLTFPMSNLKSNTLSKSIKTYSIKSKKFSQNNSSLNFRNFLTFSIKESFENEFYIDNEFYVKEIQLIKKVFFSRDSLDRKSMFHSIYFFENGKDFYKTVENK
jgi:hypothetical protein